jgi:hypothetical protein
MLLVLAANDGKVWNFDECEFENFNYWQRRNLWIEV